MTQAQTMFQILPKNKWFRFCFSFHENESCFCS